MDLAKKDILLNKMEKTLLKKKINLLKNYEHANKDLKQNKIKEENIEHYKNYFDKIKINKNKQYKALDKLSSYLDKLAKDSSITKNNIQEIKRDQKNILLEMTKIKRELVEIKNAET